MTFPTARARFPLRLAFTRFPIRSAPACRRWVLVALAALLTALPVGGGVALAARALDNFEIRNFKVGGDFTLTSQEGKPTRLSSFKGKVVVVTFGYTHCPDICPTTLADLNKVMKALGGRAEGVQVLFITVDPARDTAAHLKEYVPYFNPSFVGLTGSEAEIRAVATKYSASFAREDKGSKAGYLMAHTSFIYLLDRAGTVKYILPHDVGPKMMLDGVRRLLAMGG